MKTATEKKTIQTVVHAYNLDTSKPDDAKAYAEMCDGLKGWPHRMKSLSMGRDDNGYYFGFGSHHDGQTITLETDFLFENQWNTAPEEEGKNGWRVFDWAEDALFYPNGRENLTTRRGYWIEQTPEMREVRRNTNTCGYCGKFQPAANGSVFCMACIDSPYLKASELHLTRLRPVDTPFNVNRPELTQAEKDHLIPLYKEAQTKGTTERGKVYAAKKRSDAAEKCERAIRNATTERDGFLWLLDHVGSGIVENCIYYSHTGKFSFGWRSKGVDKEVESAILDCISEFRFPYEIKCADGRTLSGN